MIVMKFGGTSVKDSQAIARVTEIIRERLPLKPVVVVSALSGVTDTLTRIAELALKGAVEEATEQITELEKRHVAVVHQLLGSNTRLSEESAQSIEALFSKLTEIVKVISILEELSEMSLAKILSFGELLSSNIIYRVFTNSGFRCTLADARQLIITNSKYLKAEPQIDITNQRVREFLNREFLSKDVILTQGFIAATSNGTGTTLGRGGSDYTATLIGTAINAEEIEIWTDVDGIHTCDPKYVAKTKSISVISFSEAAELAFFGAKVLHPATIQPAVEKNIPVRVLNSLLPSGTGTVILKDDKIEECGVKAISFKEHIIVINIFSMKMLNTFGFLSRLFDIFARYGTSVDLISTSEVNVSLTVDSDKNLEEIINELSVFAKVSVSFDKSQVSIVGKNLRVTKGLGKKIFGAISDYNITMISQGASDVNISFVVERDELKTVVNSLHKEFFE